MNWGAFDLNLLFRLLKQNGKRKEDRRRMNPDATPP
jgi:hypothetical protein